MPLPWSLTPAQPLTATEVDAAVGDTFGSRLEELGFEYVGRRSWVRSTKTPIREEVGIGALKGNAFMPGWSISIDFVPHVTTTGKIGWHRTAKQHRGDLAIDPADDPQRLRADKLAVTGMRPISDVRRALDRSARAAIPLAEAWFARITDVPSLIPLFEEAERQPVVRFGFDNYVQHRLAFAFVLARSGLDARARAELDRWCELHIHGQARPAENLRRPLDLQLHELLEQTSP